MKIRKYEGFTMAKETENNNTNENFVTKVGEKIKNKWGKILLSINIAMIPIFSNMLPVFASGDLTPPTETSPDADKMFTNLIKFFAVWFGRIGLVVAFVGAIMFGLAIKNEDADQKSRGLMTLVAGIAVFAITKALSMFGL